METVTGARRESGSQFQGWPSQREAREGIHAGDNCKRTAGMRLQGGIWAPRIPV